MLQGLAQGLAAACRRRPAALQFGELRGCGRKLWAKPYALGWSSLEQDQLAIAKPRWATESKWLWVKKWYPNWNPGKWKLGRFNLQPDSWYFDPYTSHASSTSAPGALALRPVQSLTDPRARKRKEKRDPGSPESCSPPRYPQNFVSFSFSGETDSGSRGFSPRSFGLREALGGSIHSAKVSAQLCPAWQGKTEKTPCTMHPRRSPGKSPPPSQ